MAISHIGGTALGASSGGAITLTIPTFQANDLIILGYTHGGNTGDHAMSLDTSNFNEIGEVFRDDAADVDVAMYYKVAVGDETTVVTTATGDGGDSNTACLMVFRGVDTTTPLDVTPTSTGGLSTALADPPSIDWSTAGCWVVCFGGAVHTTGSSSAYTLPTGYTTNPLTVSANDTIDSISGMGYNSSPSDPEDPGAFAFSGTDSSNFCWGAFTVALRPAGAGGAAEQQSVILIG